MEQGRGRKARGRKSQPQGLPSARAERERRRALGLRRRNGHAREVCGSADPQSLPSSVETVECRLESQLLVALTQPVDRAGDREPPIVAVGVVPVVTAETSQRWRLISFLSLEPDHLQELLLEAAPD